MRTMQKCLLLPIDGSDKSLNPIGFIHRLYPDLGEVSMILCYFMPPLPPIYAEEGGPPSLIEKKKRFLATRERNSQTVFERARRALGRAGFPEHLIQDFSQERQMNVAYQACLLADVKKVDAVLVQKTVSSGLEGFLKGDPTTALLRHCIVSPIWFVDGEINPARAAICILNEDVSLRIADHAAFMLEDTATQIVILHVAKSISETVTVPADSFETELGWWMKTESGRVIRPFLVKACDIVREAGIDRKRIQVTLVPGRGNPAHEILSYCREQKIGIVALGHSEPGGVWSFLKNSVTKRILLDFKDMAVWVNQ